MEEEVIDNNQNEFIKKIEDLYKLHYITKNYDHIIGNKRGTWTLFEPSKFIYAFFAFNSFYNFDWKKSINERELIILEIENVEDNASIEGKKYKAMIDFIFNKAKEPEKLFFNIITNNGRYKKEIIIKIISEITIDKRITESVKKQFVNAFEKLLNKEKITIGILKDFIYFIYLVRCNIFHGTKNTIEMSKNCQRQRLDIYSNVIIAINELLFKVLENETGFRPHENYHLQLHF